MTDTDYQEKARALCHCAKCQNGEVSIHASCYAPAIAAALRAVAEEARKESPSEARERQWSLRFDYIESVLKTERDTLTVLRRKLAAVESATPESPEVKEAVEYFVSREGGHSYLAASVHGLKLVDAYRSALVRIKELESDVASNTYTQGMVESAFSASASLVKERERMHAELVHALHERNAMEGLKQTAESQKWGQEKRAEVAEAKLAALSAPVGDEEEREAMARAMTKGCFQDCQNGALHCGCGERALYVLARALRAKTAALKEAEAKIAVLKRSQMELARLLGDIQEGISRDGFCAWSPAEMKAWTKAVGEAMEIKS